MVSSQIWSTALPAATSTSVIAQQAMVWCKQQKSGSEGLYRILEP